MIHEDTKHIQWMKLAISEAHKAVIHDEVPVGAILIDDSENIIASAHNQPISRKDPTAHAEIITLRESAVILNNYRLLNTSLYVTVEPCLMCMGAIIHARVQRVVYGTADPKWGAAGSLYNFSANPMLNHHPEVIGGILEEECRLLLQTFFRRKRNLKER